MLGRPIRISADSSRSFTPVPSVAVTPRATLKVGDRNPRRALANTLILKVVDQVEPIQLKLCRVSPTSLQGEQNEDCLVLIACDAPFALRDSSAHRWVLPGATSVG